MSYSVAHELEDGFVERAVEVVVRGQTLQLKYFVGLNENTKKQLLDRWKSESGTDTSFANSVEEKTSTFEEAFPKQLSKWIKLEVDALERSLTRVGVEACPKHHFDLVVEFEYALPADQTVEIKLSDHKFNHWKSAARYSLKGVGATIVASTNVAPIIIRSDRIDFEKLSDAERSEKCRIVATVITPPDRAKNESAFE